MPVTDSFQRSVQLLRKREIAHRLHNIIERIDLIAPNGIISPVRQEHYYHITVDFPYLLSRCHSIHEAHLNVHKDYVVLSGIFFRDLVTVGKCEYTQATLSLLPCLRLVFRP